MNRNVIVSCAVTGSGDTVGKHPSIPVTPEAIATAAIEAAKAGAAIVHIHVREPDSGKPSRRVDLYREVVERIRSSDVDVIINLTTGMGGDLFLGPDDEPMNFGDDTDRSEEHTSELQSRTNLVCRLLLEKKKKQHTQTTNNTKTHTQ